MSYPLNAKWTARSGLAAGLRYGLASAAVAVVLGTTLIQRHFQSPPKFNSQLALLAVAITFWYAGTGPGLLALLLICLGVTLFLRNHILGPNFALGQFTIFYVIFAMLMGWFSASRRRAERLLTEARENLERRVAERTGELSKAFDDIKKLKDQLHEENIALSEEIDKASMFEEIVGISPALHAVLSRVQGCSHRLHCSDHRRNWDGQRTDRACHPQTITAFLTSVCQCELRSNPTRLDRIRIVRP